MHCNHYSTKRIIYPQSFVRYTGLKKWLYVSTFVINMFTHYVCIRTYVSALLPGVVIITTPASPLPIELVATTENV